MPKKIVSGQEVHTKLLSGVAQLADTVTITLGPKGRNVGIEKTFTEPVVLHDGVSVAKEIELEDPVENFGAQLVRQTSEKTADKAGDGTTTSTLLAYEMIKSGYKAIQEGANPMVLKKGMQIALNEILELLKNESKDINTKEQTQQVATISSADPQIGKTIGEAVHKVGKDGVVNVTEYEGFDVIAEYKEGMAFDKGYCSAQFATKPDGTAESEAPYILITDFVITSASDIAKFLEMYIKVTNRAEIVIIAPDVDGTALSTLIINKERGGCLPLAIKAPGIGERQKTILEDIAILTGGQVIHKDPNLKFEEIPLEALGRADRIISDATTTRIVGGFGDKDAIEERAQIIRDEIEKATSEFEKTKLRERLARLVSGAAIIKVGALTEVELSDRRERVIDAVEATKVAILEGIVPGGGVTLLKLYSDSPKLLTDKRGDPDLETGVQIVREALKQPYCKLLANAGLNVSEEDLRQAILDAKKGIGLNVENENKGKMFDMGIIDPARVVKESLQNAVSVAGMILTTEAVVTKIPEKNEE